MLMRTTGVRFITSVSLIIALSLSTGAFETAPVPSTEPTGFGFGNVHAQKGQFDVDMYHRPLFVTSCISYPFRSMVIISTTETADSPAAYASKSHLDASAGGPIAVCKPSTGVRRTFSDLDPVRKRKSRSYPSDVYRAQHGRYDERGEGCRDGEEEGGEETGDFPVHLTVASH